MKKIILIVFGILIAIPSLFSAYPTEEMMKNPNLKKIPEAGISIYIFKDAYKNKNNRHISGLIYENGKEFQENEIELEIGWLDLNGFVEVIDMCVNDRKKDSKWIVKELKKIKKENLPLMKTLQKGCFDMEDSLENMLFETNRSTFNSHITHIITLEEFLENPFMTWKKSKRPLLNNIAYHIDLIEDILDSKYYPELLEKQDKNGWNILYYMTHLRVIDKLEERNLDGYVGNGLNIIDITMNRYRENILPVVLTQCVFCMEGNVSTNLYYNLVFSNKKNKPLNKFNILEISIVKNSKIIFYRIFFLSISLAFLLGIKKGRKAIFINILNTLLAFVVLVLWSCIGFSIGYLNFWIFLILELVLIAIACFLFKKSYKTTPILILIMVFTLFVSMIQYIFDTLTSM